MRDKLSERESSFLAVSGGHGTAGLELLDRDAALPPVLGGHHMEIIDQLLLFTFS